nr:hypothetical protein [Chroococcidiopsis cubana]
MSYEVPVPVIERMRSWCRVRVVGLCQSDIKRFAILSTNHRILGMKQLELPQGGNQVGDWQVGQRSRGDAPHSL